MNSVSELFSSGSVVDFALILLGSEAFLLIVHHRRTGRGIPPVELLRALLPGACLLLALYCALVGAEWSYTAVFLGLALPAHLFDLWSRWRPAP